MTGYLIPEVWCDRCGLRSQPDGYGYDDGGSWGGS